MRRATKLSALAAVCFSFIIFLVGHALAVHDDGLFQLDYVLSPTPRGEANVWSSVVLPPGNTGDDWDEVYGGTSTAFATAFIEDGIGSAEASFFTGGGSKDTNDNPQWLYDTVNDVVPDKDDIEPAFAAAYDRPSDGPVIFYFGADRFDAGDGSAQIGFWFFRDAVTMNPLAPGATIGTFHGTHIAA